ncbi:hypothetical protein C489_09151 [Natrinema versiforme JCM 10478]|uniref:Uncharacterized protein n=1 Tax=Natrinema versiforme JCM 10478 TaxID=1227496 RepID=L9Y0Z9_9EURY|nr:hypothetical protein C489_09151 [Natrinema versiforme JCM 10478]
MNYVRILATILRALMNDIKNVSIHYQMQLTFKKRNRAKYCHRQKNQRESTLLKSHPTLFQEKV